MKIVAETEKTNSSNENCSEKENSRPKNNHMSDDMTKSPDPPPKPRDPPSQTTDNDNVKPMNFAQKVKTSNNYGFIVINY